LAVGRQAFTVKYTDMKFLSFPKISTSFSEANPSRYSGAWVAQEKVHGAQLVAGVSVKEIRFGKRKGWLSDSDTFFGWQLIRSDLQVFATKLFESFSFPKGTIAYYYGELFGGSYPHSSVDPIEGMQPVQTGVWYSPSYHWMIFDAVVCPEGELSSAYFLGARELSEGIQKLGGICPPVLSRGRLNDLLSLPVRYITRIPAKLNLPEISSNRAEGLVIKPEVSLPIDQRVVIKRKIDEFDEKRFDESEAWDPNQILSYEGLSKWASRMVNPPRLASARSKVGTDNTHALIEEVILDVMIDLEAAFPATLRHLDAEKENSLRLLITELVTAAS